MPKLTTCPNCTTALRVTDNFCPHCGQENRDLRVPVRQFLFDSLNNLLHITSFEGKIWQTLRAIFTRPGQLTIDYLAGKRARYVAPMRLYLWVSLVFFLLLGAWADELLQQQKAADPENVPSQIGVITQTLGELIRPDSLLEARGLDAVENVKISYPFSASKALLLNEKLKSATEKQLDSLLNTDKLPPTADNRRKLREALVLLPNRPDMRVRLFLSSAKGTLDTSVVFENDSARRAFSRLVPSLTDNQLDSVITKAGAMPSFWNRKILRQSGRLMDLFDGDQSIQKSLQQTFLKNVSTMMFVLMPFVAFLLWVFYVRRKQYRRFYYEHLIFSIHLHTIIFLLFALALAVLYFYRPESAKAERILSFTNSLSGLYFLLSLKRVYRQSWLRTVMKFLLLIFIYGITASLFLVGAALAGLITV